jgi:hypothetical protein
MRFYPDIDAWLADEHSSMYARPQRLALGGDVAGDDGVHSA